MQVATEMLLRGILCLQIIVASWATSIDVIHDYFLFKKITRVVGFSDYWNLGVFVDLRCSVEDKDIANIFDEASRYYMFGHLHQWLILGKNVLYDIYNHCKHCGGPLSVTNFGTCFMFRTLPSQKVDMHIIFRPLEKKVWYMFCVLSVVMVLLLRIIFKSEKQSHYGETVFVIIGAMCQQGLPLENNKLSSRVACLQTLVFGLLMYNFYSAAIVSSRLNNSPINKMNDSLTSLIKSRMKLSTYRTTFFDILINTQTADVQYFRKHWETIPEEARYQPVIDGIKGIMNPGIAYHTDPNIAYPLIERMFSNDMISQLTEVHLLRPSALGLWSAPRGQFQEIVKIGLIRTYTAGIRRRELLRWTSRKPYYNKINQEASSVTIIETVPILLLLIFGMVVSLVICILENIVFRTSIAHANRKK